MAGVVTARSVSNVAVVGNNGSIAVVVGKPNVTNPVVTETDADVVNKSPNGGNVAMKRKLVTVSTMGHAVEGI